MPDTSRPAQADIVTMMPDCTLRAIDAAYGVLRQIAPSAAAVRVDCGGVEQADFAFVQLIVSAQVTFAGHRVPFTLDPVSACVRSAFSRSGIPVPTGQNLPS